MASVAQRTRWQLQPAGAGAAAARPQYTALAFLPPTTPATPSKPPPSPLPSARVRRAHAPRLGRDHGGVRPMPRPEDLVGADRRGQQLGRGLDTAGWSGPCGPILMRSRGTAAPRPCRARRHHPCPLQPAPAHRGQDTVAHHQPERCQPAHHPVPRPVRRRSWCRRRRHRHRQVDSATGDAESSVSPAAWPRWRPTGVLKINV